jgi:hypothetical protein
MPTREPIDTNYNDGDRPRRLYKGELPIEGKMTAVRQWNSDVGAPSTTNDGYDSAGLGQEFYVGDRWYDTVNDDLYVCDDNTQNAATWTFSAAKDGLLGTKKTDETDLGDQRIPWYNSSSGKFEYGVRWDDLRFPATQAKRGASLKPDFDETNIGLLFPENVATEFVLFNAQFQHGYRLGSDIVPHIHFIQTVAAVPTFKMEYRWYDIGDTVPAFATIQTVTATSVTFSVGCHQLIEFPTISGAAISNVSSMMDIKLYRDDSAVSGDVLLKEFDIHYESDSFGSENDDSKT